MGFLRRDYDQDSVNSVADVDDPVPDLIRLMFQEYIILLLSALCATSGALLHHFYSFGSHPEIALNWIITIWLMACLDENRQIYHCVLLLSCSLFFGAIVGPKINYFVNIEQRSIIFFFGEYSLALCLHLFAIFSRKMRMIFTTNHFNLPLLMWSFIFPHVLITHGTFFDIVVPLNIQTIIPFVVSIPFIWYVGYLIFRTKNWDWGYVIPLHFIWLTVLTYSFHYNLLHLMYIYMFVLFGFHHLKLHNFDCYAFVIHGGRIDRPVTNSMTFYTYFVGRSSYLLLHFGQKLVDYIWKKICKFCIEEGEIGLIFFRKALKAALFYLVKAYILWLILTSISVGVLIILFFMYLSSKVQAA